MSDNTPSLFRNDVAESLGPNQEASVPAGSGDSVASAAADPKNQQILYPWEEGNMPSVTEYTENNGRYADDPDFRLYMVTFPVPEGGGTLQICL